MKNSSSEPFYSLTPSDLYIYPKGYMGLPKFQLNKYKFGEKQLIQNLRFFSVNVHPNVNTWTKDVPTNGGHF